MESIRDVLNTNQKSFSITTRLYRYDYHGIELNLWSMLNNYTLFSVCFVIYLLGVNPIMSLVLRGSLASTYLKDDQPTLNDRRVVHYLIILPAQAQLP